MKTLQELREDFGYTRATVSRLTGISVDRIRVIEREGVRVTTPLDKIIALADLYQVEPEYFVGLMLDQDIEAVRDIEREEDYRREYAKRLQRKK